MEEAMVKIIMNIPIDVWYRDYAGRFIRIITADIGGDTCSFHVISAFNEAFNNIIMHSNNHGSLINIKIYQLVSAIKIILEYEGAPFKSDLNDIKVPDLPENGMGLYIMKNYMTKVEYERDHNKNRWIMVKEFAPAEKTLST